MSERSERNRKIAAWLGYQEIECRIEHHGPQCWRFNGDHILRLPDFYTSEEASFMLLRKMPLPRLEKQMLPESVEAVWYCYPDPDSGRSVAVEIQIYGDEPKAIAFGQGKNPVEAIAEAALRLIETGGQRT